MSSAGMAGVTLVAGADGLADGEREGAERGDAGGDDDDVGFDAGEVGRAVIIWSGGREGREGRGGLHGPYQ